MMARNLAIGLMFSALLVWSAGPALARNIPVRGPFAGDFVAGPDTNGDGIPSVVGTNEVQELKKLGTFSADYTAELAAPLAAPSTCPPGTIEFPYLYDEGVATQVSSGDELFFSYDTAVLCLDGNTGNFTFEGTATYDGGTGQFANASGSFTAKSTGHLNSDGSGHQDGSFKGRLTVH